MDKKKRNRTLLIVTTVIAIIILLLLLVKCSTNKPKQEVIKEETTTEVTKPIDNTQDNKQEEIIVEPTTPIIEEKKTETKDITNMYFWVVFYDQYGNELQREALKYGTVPEYKNWLPEGFDSWDKEIKAIKGNTYYHAICHEVHHSSSGGSSNTPSNPSQSMPVQGDIIKLNDNKTYRVLKVTGNCVKVLGMEDASSLQCYHGDISDASHKAQFGGEDCPKYANSDLDIFLNTTWYGNLPTEMKSAIQSTPINQTGYSYHQDPDFSTFTGTIKFQYNFAPIYDGLILEGTLLVGNRNVWAIDISEIVEYLGNDISSAALNEMFFNQSTQFSSTIYVSSVNSNFSQHDQCFAIKGENATFTAWNTCTSQYAVRATFIIDLSYPGVTYTIQ